MIFPFGWEPPECPTCGETMEWGYWNIVQGLDTCEMAHVDFYCPNVAGEAHSSDTSRLMISFKFAHGIEVLSVLWETHNSTTVGEWSSNYGR